MDHLKSILEALLFAADKPLPMKQLKEVTESTAEQLEEHLEALRLEYETRGIQIVHVNGGYQFRTNPECGQWVKRLIAGKPVRLTRPMLETLAIVAYRQPVTRPEIEDIRGVDCGASVRTLMERDLIRVVGKKEEPGRPILYGTTRHFLEFFHLRELTDLPTLKEFTELADDLVEQNGEQNGETAAALSADGESQPDLPLDGLDVEQPKKSWAVNLAEPVDAHQFDDEELLTDLDEAISKADHVLAAAAPKTPPASDTPLTEQSPV